MSKTRGRGAPPPPSTASAVGRKLGVRAGKGKGIVKKTGDLAVRGKDKGKKKFTDDSLNSAGRGKGKNVSSGDGLSRKQRKEIYRKNFQAAKGSKMSEYHRIIAELTGDYNTFAGFLKENYDGNLLPFVFYLKKKYKAKFVSNCKRGKMPDINAKDYIKIIEAKAASGLVTVSRSKNTLKSAKCIVASTVKGYSICFDDEFGDGKF